MGKFLKQYVSKVVSFKTDGMDRREFPTKQILTDPFADSVGYGARIMIPPVSMEQLVLLAEAHPAHSAALEQKTQDIIASGVKFVPKGDTASDETQKKKLEEWWESLFEEATSVETLYAVENDEQTVGWGTLEFARDAKGLVARAFHVPAHTVRATAKTDLLVQMRHGKQAFFKRWTPHVDPNEPMLLANGNRANESTNPERLANELLVFRRPSRRSTWYGIPGYIAAMGALTLAVAARDYNILFFENSREPRYAVVITGLDDDVEVAADEIELALKINHKEPHRNIVLPFSEGVEIKVIEMGVRQNDMHFAKLLEETRNEVLIAHRTPPDRLGLALRGFLGGTVASVNNRTYKEGVVARGQDLVEDRLGKFVDVEFERSFGEQPVWKPDLEDLDTADEKADTEVVIAQVKANLITLNEGRKRLDHDEHEPFADMTLAQYLVSIGAGQGTVAAAVAVDSTSRAAATSELSDAALAVRRKLEDVEGYIDELLGASSPESNNGHFHADVPEFAGVV